MKRLIAAWHHWREVRAFDRAHRCGTPTEIVTPPGGVRIRAAHDWLTDETLTTADKMRRFEALHPEQTRGAFKLSTAGATLTTGSASTWTYTYPREA